MEFSHLQRQAFAIRDLYKASNARTGQKQWTETEYAQALVSDASDLLKLLMAKNGFRHPVADLDQKIEHEVSDCLWAILVTAAELGIDLEASFAKNMEALEARIESTDAVT